MLVGRSHRRQRTENGGRKTRTTVNRIPYTLHLEPDSSKTQSYLKIGYSLLDIGHSIFLISCIIL